VQARIMSNPCFYLFAGLLLLLILLPLFEDSDVGKLWFMVMNLLVLVSSGVVLGRGRVFWDTLLLAGAAFGLLVAFHVTGGSGYLAWSWRCSVGVFVVTLVHLIRYVLRRLGNTKPLFPRHPFRQRPLLARSDGGSPSTWRQHAAAAHSKAWHGLAQPGHAAQDGLR
jgi:hypothetical protein